MPADVARASGGDCNLLGARTEACHVQVEWFVNEVDVRRFKDQRGKELAVKTMTCNQLGGPCDFAHHGKTADEVIKAQDRHLREMVAGGDATHEGALKDMKGRWKHPIAGMGWYRQAKQNFAALPED